MMRFLYAFNEGHWELVQSCAFSFMDSFVSWVSGMALGEMRYTLCSVEIH